MLRRFLVSGPSVAGVPKRLKYSVDVEARYKAATNRTDPHVGKMSKNDDNVGLGTVGSGACGDMMRVYLKVEDGKVADVKYKTFGCSAAIAASSYAAEHITGKSIEEAEALTNQQIASELALPPVKLHCSLLAQEAIQSAIKNWKLKQEGKSKSRVTPVAPASAA